MKPAEWTRLKLRIVTESSALVENESFKNYSQRAVFGFGIVASNLSKYENEQIGTNNVENWMP